jgi:hypothetical protein
MIWANPIASASEEDCRNDGRNIDDLHECKQSVASKYAVAQKKCASNKPD